MLNIFRTLIYPSSGICDFSIVHHIGRVFCKDGGFYTNAKKLHLHRTHDQCGDTIEKSQAPDDGHINVENMFSIEEVK